MSLKHGTYTPATETKHNLKWTFVWTPEKIFAPLGKMCWKYFKTIGNSLKNLGRFQKTLSLVDVPSWLQACVLTKLKSSKQQHVLVSFVSRRHCT